LLSQLLELALQPFTRSLSQCGVQILVLFVGFGECLLEAPYFGFGDQILPFVCNHVRSFKSIAIMPLEFPSLSR